MYLAWAGMKHGFGQCCSVCMHAAHGWEEWGMWRRAASWRVCEFACGWLNLQGYNTISVRSYIQPFSK
eukprot:scaffold21497_cov128-Isochrysis_galbana.AAC.2